MAKSQYMPTFQKDRSEASRTGDVGPTGSSPRFNAVTAKPADIERAIDDIGHCVLENAFRPTYLGELRDVAANAFTADDRRYLSDATFADTELETYLGGVTDFPEIAARAPNPGECFASMNARFFDQLGSSPLPDIFHYLFHGAFVAFEGERCLRRTDPRFPVRFAGLHVDGQLDPCSSEGIRTRRALTAWTPLQAVTDDALSRLLLLHKRLKYSEHIAPLFSDAETISERGVAFLPIQLKPFQVRDESAAAALGDVADAMFDRLYGHCGNECFAPKLKLGSVVLFAADVLHCSYVTRYQTRPRYSLDFRCAGEYRITEANKASRGRLFKLQSCPHNIPEPPKRGPFKRLLAWLRAYAAHQKP